MKHYLDASGRTLAIDLEGMIASGPTATARFKNEVRQAQLFVKKLPVGTHVFTSVTAESAYNFKNESNNWYFAVGGYSTWGKGSATVRNNAAGKECEMQFEYRFYDRYNWDNGKSVTIAGITITDRFMGSSIGKVWRRSSTCWGPSSGCSAGSLAARFQPCSSRRRVGDDPAHVSV